MADFPNPGTALPLFINAAQYGHGRAVIDFANISVGADQTSTWVAKLVQYMPVFLPFDYPVNRVYWMNGGTVTSSNADFGIYTPDGTRIYNTGSTVMSGTNTPQYVTVATPFVLPAGRCYFAWTCDNTTSRAKTLSGSALAGQGYGMLQETTVAFGLPATMTPVSFAQAWGYVVCGVTRTTTGF